MREVGVEVQGAFRLAELMGGGQTVNHQGPCRMLREQQRKERRVVEGRVTCRLGVRTRDLYYCRRCGKAEWENSGSGRASHPCPCASMGEVLIAVDVFVYVHVYTCCCG